MQIQHLFKLGMKRDLPDLIEYEDGVVVDVGSTGKFKVPGAISIGLPEWRFPDMRMPFEDGAVTTLHAYHFLEHLPGEHALLFLRELERVMVPGRSVFNFSVPYFSSSLAVQDLTHKSFWCEDSFKTTFENWTYDPDGKGDWMLKVHFLMIAGVVGRNLALIGQLVRA
jgi:hypothetical protein